MPNLNKVLLMGNLTRDPELKQTASGTQVADMGLAINRRTKDNEETTFVDVTLWGKQAEIAAQYLRKGRPVYIEGRLQLDSWEDRQSGQKRTKLKVVGESIQFIDSQKSEDGNGARGSEARRTIPHGHPAPAMAGADDDEIPF